jgi:hypothetical protein
MSSRWEKKKKGVVGKWQQGSEVGVGNISSRETMREIKTEGETTVSKRGRGVAKKRKSKREFCGVPPPGWTRGHINLSSFVHIDLRTIY